LALRRKGKCGVRGPLRRHRRGLVARVRAADGDLEHVPLPPPVLPPGRNERALAPASPVKQDQIETPKAADPYGPAAFAFPGAAAPQNRARRARGPARRLLPEPKKKLALIRPDSHYIMLALLVLFWRFPDSYFWRRFSAPG